MIVSLIILIALIAVGALLYAHHRLSATAEEAEPAPAPSTPAPQDDGEECCGMHIACEKDSLLAAVSKEVVYYDDEELDSFRGRLPDQYSEEEIEQFRDVLLTLLPTDIAGWSRSLQLRGIDLPYPVREELLLIVAEERQKRSF